MPAIVRKLVIYAAVDGLVLQPLAQRGQRPTTPVIIDYTTQHDVRPLLQYSQIEQHTDKQIECFGVVGMKAQVNIMYHHLTTLCRSTQGIKLCLCHYHIEKTAGCTDLWQIDLCHYWRISHTTGLPS